MGPADRHRNRYFTAVHAFDQISQPPVLPERLSGEKVEINEQELAALNYDISSFDDGKEFEDPAHLYTYDLDVFGPHSLFQYVNRTCTQLGKKRLASWFNKHLEKKEEILKRQEAIRELAPELKFRQHFRILGLLHKGKAADEAELNAWAASPDVFRTKKFLRILPAAVTAINVACILLIFAGILPATIYGFIWTCFVIAGFSFTGKITKIQTVYGKNCGFSLPMPYCSASWKSSLCKPRC